MRKFSSEPPKNSNKHYIVFDKEVFSGKPS